MEEVDVWSIFSQFEEIAPKNLEEFRGLAAKYRMQALEGGNKRYLSTADWIDTWIDHMQACIRAEWELDNATDA